MKKKILIIVIIIVALKGKVIIAHDKITNMYLLDNCLDNTDKYNKNAASDKIEIVTYTIEGDEILTTLEYNKENNEIIVTKDNTKDKFAAEEDRKIETKKYSNSTYNLAKKIEDNYIYLNLEADESVDREIDDITICLYRKDLEKNKDTSRTKIKDVSLKAEEISTEELVFYNGVLYGKSYGIIDFAAQPTDPIGTINKLVGEEYLPELNGETNTEKLLNAKVYSSNERSMILIVDNEAILYRAIEGATHSFFAQVIESKEKYIIVEPVEGSKELKSADRISIGLEENNDVIYPVGTKVKITYNGMIMEAYPAKINAMKIEIE